MESGTNPRMEALYRTACVSVSGRYARDLTQKDAPAVMDQIASIAEFLGGGPLFNPKTVEPFIRAKLANGYKWAGWPEEAEQ